MIIISDSIKGPRKKRNEDRILIINEDYYKIFFLFDGVGSAINGKRASSDASNFIEKNYNFYINKGYFLLRNLIYDTNKYLINSEYYESYTTYCSACIFFNKNSPEIVFSNLGDSKIYLFNNQSLKQISIDDSLYPNSNVITKCLGLSNLKLKDIREYKINNYNFGILLCSDGFSNILEEEKGEFLKIFNSRYNNTIESRINSLIYKKNDDDCSYILIKQNV